jgi:hypothetical protein
MADILSSTLRQTAPPLLSMSRHGAISNEIHHRSSRTVAAPQYAIFVYGAGEWCAFCCSGDMKDASPLWAERLFDDAEEGPNQE